MPVFASLYGMRECAIIRDMKNADSNRRVCGWMDGLTPNPKDRETLAQYLRMCHAVGAPENLTPREVEAWARERDAVELVALVVAVRRRMEYRKDAAGRQWHAYGYTPDARALRPHAVNRYNRRHGKPPAGV